MLDRKLYMKEYQKNNKEKIKEYKNKWYLENRERTLKQKEIYYKNNKKEMIEYHRKYCKSNSEKLKEYQRKYMKEYRNIYKEKLNNERNKWVKKKNKINLKFNLNNRISSAVRHSLKGNKNGRYWESLVGYTLNKLFKHLKKTMPKNYCWNDFLQGRLHIDHIIPKSVFNYTQPEHIDFKRCWALKNLQLLPAEENYKKNNKIYKSFQPALKI